VYAKLRCGQQCQRHGLFGFGNSSLCFSILGTHLFAVLYNAVRLFAQARIQKDSMKSFVPVLGFCLLGLEMVAKFVEGILVVQFLLVCLSP
jgi:hypothetical protein